MEYQFPIVFDPKNKAASLTLQDLTKTADIENHMGELPKQCPVPPSILLGDIFAKIRKATGLEPEAQPIVIREQYCQILNNYKKQDRQPELSDYVVTRFVTKILLPMDEFIGTPDHMRPGIAFTYSNNNTAKGMQLAFGENVSVCDNLCAWGKYHFSTYGGQKVEFEQGVQLLMHWLERFERVHSRHIETIHALKEREVERREFSRIIGTLFERAVRANLNERLIAPMNQTEMARMVTQAAEALREEDRLITGWDIMNWGTEILKPQTSDMISLLENTTRFNDFVLDTLDIPHVVVD
jgi:hypothetical protein